MVIFNLLPWRDRKTLFEKNRLRKIFLTTFIVGISIIYGIQYLLHQYEIRFNDEVQRLQEEALRFSNSILLTEDKKQNALSQETMQNFLNYHHNTQALFFALTQRSNRHICFIEITREKNSIIFIGNARSTMDLTDFLKTWQAVSLFSEIRITYLKRNPESDFINFRFEAIENFYLEKR